LRWEGIIDRSLTPAPELNLVWLASFSFGTTPESIDGGIDANVRSIHGWHPSDIKSTERVAYMLNADAIRFFRPVTRKQKLFDEKGLYLLLTPSGGRLWRFKYRFPPRAPGNKEKCLSLGAYPEVSLERARKRRDAARVDVANGTDPNLRRVCEKICRGNTFEAVAREFFSVLRAAGISAETPSPVVAGLIQQTLKPLRYRRPRTREPISEYTVDLMERRLEMHVFPYIGERDVRLLSAPELLEVLRRIESRGTYNLAHRVRSICSRVLRYARATGRKCEDVAADLVGVLIPVVPEHMAAIVEPVKIGRLLRSIEGYRGDPLTRLALKLIPYIFPRPIELRTMEWDHLQLHGASPEWRVPWRRMKARQPHIVPLSRQAAEILREAHLLTGEGRWVFPQMRNPDLPMSENCITAALRAMGYRSDEMSWHGFRALASTQLHELGWNDRWIETQLAHADRNKVGSAYNHAKYLPQRRTMMQAWSDYLDTLRAQTDITISHHAGEQAALTAMEAFQHADSQRALSFQTQAMEALHAIVLLSKRHRVSEVSPES
jgi:integrase